MASTSSPSVLSAPQSASCPSLAHPRRSVSSVHSHTRQRVGLCRTLLSTWVLLKSDWQPFGYMLLLTTRKPLSSLLSISSFLFVFRCLYLPIYSILLNFVAGEQHYLLIFVVMYPHFCCVRLKVLPDDHPWQCGSRSMITTFINYFIFLYVVQKHEAFSYWLNFSSYFSVSHNLISNFIYSCFSASSQTYTSGGA